MNVLYAFVRASFHNVWIFRLEFWLITPGLLIMMYDNFSIWSILYQQSPHAFGMDLERMTTYGVLGILLMPLMRTAWITQYYIAQQVRQGTLELDLMKPLDFMWHMLSRNLGELGVESLLRFVPGLVFAYLFLDFRLPPNVQVGLAFLASLALGYLVHFGVSFLFGLLSIVTLDIRSYAWAFNSIMRLASGQLVPLWMFPPALAAIAAALPFQAVFFVPMSIYVGAHQGSLAKALLSQAAWAIGLFLAARFFWTRVQRRITVQGG
ncbi:MAG: ABC-2 family transporter protein [Anaerolineae bacterium]|nr:MAG: ABC-2 family transporter protein [Anaerolineae bacterium]